MTANTQTDYQLKMGIIEDTLILVDMEKLYICFYAVSQATKTKWVDLISYAREKEDPGMALLDKKSASSGPWITAWRTWRRLQRMHLSD